MVASSFLAVAILALVSTVAGTVTAGSDCPAGSFSSNGKAPCSLCDPGTYNQNTGQKSCRNAQRGWYAYGSGPDGSGAKEQKICQQGYYSSSEGSASCTICPAGSYCNGQGQTQPVLCPPGRYSPTPGTGQMCLECPRGQFVSIRGATSCCSCCSGFYNDQTSQDHCFPCPVRGAFSPIGATYKEQCANRAGGGLLTCSMSGSQCPDGGSSPSGIYRRREVKRSVCPTGHKSCPIYGSATSGRGFLKAYECVDVRNDLESCGGCVADDSPTGERTHDGGRDCSAIPNVDAVTCREGACVIKRCRAGYAPSSDGMRCLVSVFNVQQSDALVRRAQL